MNVHCLSLPGHGIGCDSMNRLPHMSSCPEIIHQMCSETKETHTDCVTVDRAHGDTDFGIICKMTFMSHMNFLLELEH